MKGQLLFALWIACFSMIGVQTSCTANTDVADKEMYELRSYHLKFGSSSAPLIDYLNNVLEPAFRAIGVNHFMKFREYSQEEPGKIWVLISYPNASIYTKAQMLTSSDDFIAKSKSYAAIGPGNPPYTRMESSLLLAIDGIPKLVDPIEGAGLFEIRFYEGYNEDATRRKIKMFNDEELPLFDKTGLHSIFFGDMISGPYRPCLVYMLGFKDLEERDANWKTFIDHPEWKAMVVKPEYANTVSNIRKIFLTPM